MVVLSQVGSRSVTPNNRLRSAIWVDIRILAVPCDERSFQGHPPGGDVSLDELFSFDINVGVVAISDWIDGASGPEVSALEASVVVRASPGKAAHIHVNIIHAGSEADAEPDASGAVLGPASDRLAFVFELHLSHAAICKVVHDEPRIRVCKFYGFDASGGGRSASLDYDRIEGK